MVTTASCGGDLNLDDRSNNVRVQVVDSVGVPMRDMNALFDDTVFRTDNNGQFVIPNAPAKYDVAIQNPNSYEAFIFNGMTSRTPTFRIGDGYGYGYPQAGTAQIYVGPDNGWDGPAIAILLEVDDSVHATTSYFSATAQWTGPTEIPYTLHLFRYNRADFSGFDGYAKFQGTLTSGTSLNLNVDTWQALPFDQKSLSVNVNFPDDSYISGGALYARRSKNAPPSLFADFIPPTYESAVSVLAPLIPNVSWDLEVSAKNAFGYSTQRATSLQFGASPIDVVIPQPTEAQFPSADANDVTINTEFRWAPGQLGASFVRLIPDAPHLPYFTVYTEGDSVRIMDLSKLDLALPQKQSYHWWVSTRQSHTVEDFAQYGQTGLPFGNQGYGESKDLQFTTQ